LDFWAEKSGCSTRKTEVLPDPSRRGKKLERTTIQDCKTDVEILGITIEEGDHIWPYGFYYLSENRAGYLSRDVETTREILRFFLGRKKQKQSTGIDS